MATGLWILALILLLITNAVFVLAEFAIVKVRPSRVEEMRQRGEPRATLLAAIVSDLDQYLGVCQVGVTFASVALGMVGKALTDSVLHRFAVGSHHVAVTFLGVAVGLFLVSGAHVILGEQVPKYAAVRTAHRVALRVARPLHICRWLFLPFLWGMNRIALSVLRLLRIERFEDEECHSEEELRILLDRGQERGILSLRRLIFMENIFDLGGLRVKDAMRPRAQVVSLKLKASAGENAEVMRKARHSRFPVIDTDPECPAGMVHIKDLFLSSGDSTPDLGAILRPCLMAQEVMPLETMLAEMQRTRRHAAIVLNTEGRWTGLISMEDILEEIVGTVDDEFEEDAPIQLSEVITRGRVVLGVEARSMADAVRVALRRVPPEELPIPAVILAKAVLARDRFAPVYLGNGLALPHARLSSLDRPILVFIRSARGIPVDRRERAYLLFLLITPLGQPRVHQKLQARIARILENSDYVEERLRGAGTQDEVLEAIHTGEQAIPG